MSLLSIAIFMYAFHLPMSAEEIVIILLVTSFGVAIPAAPGCVGTYDYFAKMSLMLYGVNASTAASFAIVTHIISIVPLTVIGMTIVYPVIIRLKNRTMNYAS
jgi:hypothetical protein